MAQFIQEYGMVIFGIIITAVASYLGIGVKFIYQKICNTKLKQEIARTCVLATEQIYKDLHGEAKYMQCAASVVQLLEEKGIKVSELEVRQLIESAVKQMNETFVSVFDYEGNIEY